VFESLAIAFVSQIIVSFRTKNIFVDQRLLAPIFLLRHNSTFFSARNNSMLRSKITIIYLILAHFSEFTRRSFPPLPDPLFCIGASGLCRPRYFEAFLQCLGQHSCLSSWQPNPTVFR
jgi:hypothetical protein